MQGFAQQRGKGYCVTDNSTTAGLLRAIDRDHYRSPRE
jgi:hypothetical protein